jgi:glycosyltransferase involved in cell wall biosynthesis
MVAIEAAASGIPTLAHPTPGLTEALAGTGVLIHRDRTRDWADTIRALDDPTVYAGHSARARARALDLDPTADLDNAAATIHTLTTK